jgi:uncharacterized membrane protein YccC
VKQSGGGMIGATVVLTGLLWLLSKMVGFELSVLIGISLVFAAICDLHSNLFGR